MKNEKIKVSKSLVLRSKKTLKKVESFFVPKPEEHWNYTFGLYATALSSAVSLHDAIEAEKRAIAASSGAEEFSADLEEFCSKEYADAKNLYKELLDNANLLENEFSKEEEAIKTFIDGKLNPPAASSDYLRNLRLVVEHFLSESSNASLNWKATHEAIIAVLSSPTRRRGL